MIDSNLKMIHVDVRGIIAMAITWWLGGGVAGIYTSWRHISVGWSGAIPPLLYIHVMPELTEQEKLERRREKRKQKILASAENRLNRITGTAFRK